MKEKIDKHFYKVLGVILATLLGFGTNGTINIQKDGLDRIGDISRKIEVLNTNLTKILTEQINQKEDIIELKSRVLFLERKTK